VLTESLRAIAAPLPFTRVVTLVDFGTATVDFQVAFRPLPTSPLKETSFNAAPVVVPEAELDAEPDAELELEPLSSLELPHAARAGSRSTGTRTAAER
jgi:hypothetical protein